MCVCVCLSWFSYYSNPQSTCFVLRLTIASHCSSIACLSVCAMVCVCVCAACIYLCSQTNLPFWHHKRGSCSSDRVINENEIHTIKYLWQLPRGEDVAQGRRELLLVDTHNALPLALIYLASAIQRLSQCQQDTSHGGRGTVTMNLCTRQEN